MVRQRELRPALTETELADVGQVFAHAQRRTALHGPLVGSKRAQVVVKCNQLASDNASICDWSRTLETRVDDAERVGKQAIADHLKAAHPYLDKTGRRSLVGNAWVNLRDITGGR